MIETDAAAERDGVWAKFDLDFELRVASAFTREYETERAKIIAPYLALIRDDLLTPEQSDKLDAEVACKLLLRDWRGLTRNGEQVKYTPEAGMELMARPGGRRVLTFVQGAALSNVRFRVKLREAAAKN